MYLVVDEATSEAAVVDPYNAQKISSAVKEQGVNVSRFERSRNVQADGR